MSVTIEYVPCEGSRTTTLHESYRLGTPILNSSIVFGSMKRVQVYRIPLCVHPTGSRHERGKRFSEKKGESSPSMSPN